MSETCPLGGTILKLFLVSEPKVKILKPNWLSGWLAAGNLAGCNVLKIYEPDCGNADLVEKLKPQCFFSLAIANRPTAALFNILTFRGESQPEEFF